MGTSEFSALPDACSSALAPTAGARRIESSTTAIALMVRRTPSGIRVRTRRGYDWTERFSLIVEAAGRLRAMSFVLDGEGVILRPDGVSDFEALHDGQRNR